jgi:ParB-like chromosome segregation protein Spo0J
MNVEFPVLDVKMVRSEKVVANDYNPNKVAIAEFELLITSIREDGVTQPIVTFYDESADQYIIVDGFHRWRVLVEHFQCPEIPIVVIRRDLAQRMAATIRHNRARGKHQVDLQAELVRSLMHLGLDDEAISENLGMTVEELLRLKQTVGAARLLAADQYGEFYGRDDEPPLPPEDEP